MPTPQRQDHTLHEDATTNMLISDPGGLRRHRETKRMSLREVADHAGLSHTQISNYERGIHTVIKEDVARRLSRFIGFPMEDVFSIEPGFVADTVTTGADTTTPA